MKKIFYLVIILSLTKQLDGQTIIDTVKTPEKSKEQALLIKRTKNLTGFASFGWKNTYGAWGGFYGRSFNIRNAQLEARLGIGIKNSFVIGGGLNFRIYTDKRKTEFFIATDYSYNSPGTIRFDDEKNYKPYYSDQYKFTECHYLHSYLISRYFLSNDNVSALQLKTGYAFLLNDVSVNHTYGPDVNYSKAKRYTASGLMVGIDLVLYLKYFQDFRKTKN